MPHFSGALRDETQKGFLEFLRLLEGKNIWDVLWEHSGSQIRCGNSNSLFLSNKANTRGAAWLQVIHPSEYTVLNFTRDKCCQPTLGIHRETTLHRYTCRITPTWKQIPITQGFWGTHQLHRVNTEPLSPKGGSGQAMFVPEESGKEEEKPTNTQAPWGLVFHEVSLMMSYKKWATPTCDLLRGCTAPECF